MERADEGPQTGCRAISYLTTLAVLCFVVLTPAPGEGVQPTPPSPSGRSFESSPEFASVISEGTSEFEAGDFKAAYKHYRKADELAGGRSWDAVAGAVAASIQIGKISRALGDARRLLDIDHTAGRMGIAHHLVGVCLARKGSFREAEIALKEALELLPERPRETRQILASVLCDLRRETEGLKLLDDDGRCAQSSLESTDGTAADGPYRFESGGEITEPKRLSGDNPRYNDAARRARAEGTVAVDLIIGADGEIKCAKVSKGLSHGLSCSAALALFNWKFQPGELRGKPVELFYPVTASFDLR